MVKIDFSNNSEPAINDTNLNQMQLNIENAINSQVSGDTLPVGSIVAFSSATIPTNWLLCDGRAISRTEYALLFSIIGTTYGVGDGSTTFNLPNLKGRVPVGVDSSQTEFDTLGETGGEKTHTLTVDEMPSHFHGGTTLDNAVGTRAWKPSGSALIQIGDGAGYEIGTINPIGGGQPHNILQPYQTTNYIIKAFSSAGLVANIANGYSTSQNDAYSCDYVNNLNTYSTTEKRIGTWIDGKPLYGKVIDFGACPDNSVKQVPHNIVNLKRVVKLLGFGGSSLSKGGITLPHGSNNPIALYCDDTNVTVNSFQNASAYTETYIYMEYIKTTD